MPNMFDMLRQAHAMKEKMKTFQDELERFRSASVGNGAVTVVLNGKYEVQKVTLDPKALQSGDGGKLEILIQTAVNEAGQQVKEKLKSEVRTRPAASTYPVCFDPMYPPSLERLLHELEKLPGIGPRTAQRLAFHLLKQPSRFPKLSPKLFFRPAPIFTLAGTVST